MTAPDGRTYHDPAAEAFGADVGCLIDAAYAGVNSLTDAVVWRERSRTEGAAKAALAARKALLDLIAAAVDAALQSGWHAGMDEGRAQRDAVGGAPPSFIRDDYRKALEVLRAYALDGAESCDDEIFDAVMAVARAEVEIRAALEEHADSDLGSPEEAEAGVSISWNESRLGFAIDHLIALARDGIWRARPADEVAP